MTLTIGRCSGLRPAPGYPLRSGSRVSVRGTIMAADTDELRARRQQILGMVGDTDDEVVPMIWSTDATLDGFYRVSDASVEQIGPTGSKRARFAVDLVPILGASAPLVELDASAVVRTNTAGVTATEPSAISSAIHQSASTYDTTGGTLFFRTGSDGDVYLVTQAAPFTRVTQAFPAIASRYAGACRIEAKYGSTWYDVVGQQMPSAAAGNWRISNGLVRFTYAGYTGTSATVGGLLVEVWDSGAWVTTVTFKLGTWTGAAFSDADWAGDGVGSTADPTGAVVACPVRVVRNSPETVTLGFNKRNGATQYVSLDMGAMFCTLTTRAPGAVEPMLRPVAAETAAGVGAGGIWTYDPGVERSTNDANGNRYCILYTASNFTNSGGGIRHGGTVAANTAVSFGLGVVLGGSSAAANDTGRELGEQYVGQAAWRQRVVVR